MTWRAMTKVSVGCGLCRTGRMHVPIGGPLVFDASEATGAFGGKRAARSRSTLRHIGASGRIAGDGEHGPPTVGFAVAITSFGFSHEGAVERDLSNVRYPAPTGRSPIQVRWQDSTHQERSGPTALASAMPRSADTQLAPSAERIRPVPLLYGRLL